MQDSDSNSHKKLSKTRAVILSILIIGLAIGVFYTRNSSALKGPISATEYCQMLYDAPSKIWEAQDPVSIRKIARDIERNKTEDPKLNESGKKVAKAIYKVADAVEETFASGLNGDAFSALAGFGSIGIAAVELGVAESEVQGCNNWTPPSTQIPS